jgi:hypothetical protein
MQATKYRLGLFFYLFFNLSFCGVLAAEKPMVFETKKDNPKSVLLVGNSFMYYNNGVHKPLLGMIKAEDSLGKGHRLRSITINSSSLEWHDVKSYVTNPNIGSFAITSENKYKKYKTQGFDLAILMDCSQCPIHPDRQELFNFYADKHVRTLKDNGVEPTFMMTWAYEDEPQMMQGLEKGYTKVGNRNNALVLPVGLAFQASVLAYPDIKLYTKDKRHPSREGTYLMAAVMFSAIYRVSPIGNEYDYGLAPEVTKRLQKIALMSLDYYKN